MDGRLDLFIALQASQVPVIKPFDEPQSLALQFVGFVRRDVGERLLLGRVDERCLVHGGKKAVAEDTHAAQRRPTAGQHHEARQVLILAAQAVGHPRARTGISGL